MGYTEVDISLETGQLRVQLTEIKAAVDARVQQKNSDAS